MKRQNPNKEELYSLFIQYHNNELPLSANNKIAKTIQECKECQEIYNDIVDFFDEGEAFIFELKQPSKVESIKRTARKIAIQGSISKKTTILDKSKFDLSSLHCCGS